MSAVSLYFQLNYIPGKIQFLNRYTDWNRAFYMYKNNKTYVQQWYTIPYHTQAAEQNPLTYEQQQNKLVELMDDAVRLRLIADVPLGLF